jgi:uncharacterized protein YdbL (DUF1318 family)
MFNSNWLRVLVLALAFGTAQMAAAQANLQIDTPAISALRTSLRENHKQIRPFYVSGAIGLMRDGSIGLRDANSIPLAERAQVNALIAQANRDRAALYREIALANKRPEWEGEIRSTFAQRWIERAPAGWYYQNASGAWVQK